MAAAPIATLPNSVGWPKYIVMYSLDNGEYKNIPFLKKQENK